MYKSYLLSQLYLEATGTEAVLGNPLGSAQGLNVFKACQLGVIPLLVEEGTMVILLNDRVLLWVLDSSDGIPIWRHLLVDNLLSRKKQMKV